MPRWIEEDDIIEEPEPARQDSEAYLRDKIIKSTVVYTDFKLLSPENQETLFQRMIGLVIAKRDSILGLQKSRHVSPEDRGRKATQANLKEVLPLQEVWAAWMAEYSIGQLCGAAIQTLQASVFVAGNAKLDLAMNGKGELRDGVWHVPDDAVNNFVVNVSPEAMATSVVLASTLNVKSKAENGEKATHVYKLEAVAPKFQIPVKYKQLLRPACIVKTVTDHSTNKVSYVYPNPRDVAGWEATPTLLNAGTRFAGTIVDSGDMDVQSWYFYTQNFDFPFPFMRWHPDDLVRCPDPKFVAAELVTKLGNYSFLCGGQPLPKECIMAQVQADLFPRHQWFGGYANKLPDFALFKGARFAGDGKKPGNPALELDIVNCGDGEFHNCDGIIWNPPAKLLPITPSLKKGEYFGKTDYVYGIRGYAIPYVDSASFIDNVVCASTLMTCKVYQVFCSSPFILIIFCDDGYHYDMPDLKNFCLSIGQTTIANWWCALMGLVYGSDWPYPPIMYRELGEEPVRYDGRIYGRHCSGSHDEDVSRLALLSLAARNMPNRGDGAKRKDNWATKPRAKRTKFDNDVPDATEVDMDLNG